MNTFALWVGGLLLGIGIGMFLANFVTAHNVEYHSVQHQKQLVELGVGYYDTNTGSFQTKACVVQ
jgi:hypothetical protein